MSTSPPSSMLMDHIAPKQTRRTLNTRSKEMTKDTILHDGKEPRSKRCKERGKSNRIESHFGDVAINAFQFHHHSDYLTESISFYTNRHKSR